MGEGGLLGLTALPLFYFGTTVYFWRHRRSDDRDISTADRLGPCVSLGAMIFGLTIAMLSVTYSAFFGFCTVTLLAIIYPRTRELPATSQVSLA
jgi:O-antigen ligase